jgi:glucose/arabinose dehydrogenase
LNPGEPEKRVAASLARAALHPCTFRDLCAQKMTAEHQTEARMTTDTKPAKPKATNTDRLEALKQKQAQLRAQIVALEAKEKAAERKKDTRRKIIVGGAVLAHAALHPAFAAELKNVLKLAVTREIDRAAIQDLLE